MSNRQDVIFSADANDGNHTPAHPVSSSLRKATEYLLEIGAIGFSVDRPKGHPRYVTLQSTEIFSSLVNFYATNFRSEFEHLQSLTEQFQTPAGIDTCVYMARIYISHWFLDLYNSIREACLKHPAIEFSKYYSEKLVYYSRRYDNFLVLVNAAIRPTLMSGTFEESLYVPVIADPISWNNSNNPFSITNFTLNADYFGALLANLGNGGVGWAFATLTNNANGRPSWLFDWHDEDRVCAWFPNKGNYNNEDSALAYIIGVGCTPHLAPRDVDDWQNYSVAEIDPTKVDLMTLDRVESRHWWGAYEVRTVAPRMFVVNFPAPARQMQDSQQQTTDAGNGGSVGIAPAPRPETISRAYTQFQITDWTYCARVIHNRDEDSRMDAFRILVGSSA